MLKCRAGISRKPKHWFIIKIALTDMTIDKSEHYKLQHQYYALITSNGIFWCYHAFINLSY